MRQSYLKNAALLTGADVVLRLAGMGLRIWLANALGGEGMGLYQLVLAVYGAVRHAGYGGRLGGGHPPHGRGAEPGRASARGMLARLRRWGAGLGVLGHGGTGGPCRVGGCLVAGGCAGGRARCGCRRSGCPGWPSRRCCGGSSSPGGGWAPTCSASWRSRRCASGVVSGVGAGALRGWDAGGAARWCWGPPP